jgi:hypothetical protein
MVVILMNINNNFNTINEIKTFLQQLNNADWKVEDISPDKIQSFIHRHLEIISNQKVLLDEMMQLSNRIFTEFKNNPEACQLSLVIMGITKPVLESKQNSPRLPAEIWEQIVSSFRPAPCILFPLQEKGFGAD